MLSCLVNGQYTEASKDLDRNLAFKCPKCNDDLILRAGIQNIPHFSHKKNSDCILINSSTTWHRKAKLCIAKIARWKGFEVKFEAEFGDHHTDVFIFNDKVRIGVELQRGDKGKDIYQRTHDLLQYVDKVVWVIPYKPLKRFSNGVIEHTYKYGMSVIYGQALEGKLANVSLRFYDSFYNQTLSCDLKEVKSKSRCELQIREISPSNPEVYEKINIMLDNKSVYTFDWFRFFFLEHHYGINEPLPKSKGDIVNFINSINLPNLIQSQTEMDINKYLTKTVYTEFTDVRYLIDS